MADDSEDTGVGGRPLTLEEIADARSIFGNTIDYGAVRIIKDNNEIFSFDDRGAAFDTDIFIPDSRYHEDFSEAIMQDRSLLIHELTHVYQAQNGIDINASMAQMRAENNGNYDAGYAYDLGSGKTFFDFNIEQQAMIAQHAFEQASPQKGDLSPAFRDVLPFEDFGGERPIAPVPTPSQEEIDAAFDAPLIASTQPDPLLVDILLGVPEDTDGPTVRPINEDGSPVDAGAPTPPAEPQVRPINEDGPPVDAGAQQVAEPQIRPINDDGSPVEPVAQTGAVAPRGPQAPAQGAPSGQDDDGPTLGELTGGDGPPNGDDGIPIDEEDEPQFDNRSEEEIGAELEAVLRGEDPDQDDDSDADDDVPEDEEPEAGGDGSERPNEVDDPNPGSGDASVLANRNGPATNPGPGGIDVFNFDGEIFDLFDRNVPATNPGSGDFDMPVVTGSVSDLFDRNDFVINTGNGDFDMPVVQGDIGDLLGGNGPRETPGVDDTELAASTHIGSDLNFDIELDNLAFDLV